MYHSRKSAQLLLGERRIDERKEMQVKREVPRGVPRVPHVSGMDMTV